MQFLVSICRPLRKYLHEKVDDTYQASIHELTGMQELAEQIVRYDLDDQDVTWLQLVNEDREEMGESPCFRAIIAMGELCPPGLELLLL